MPTYIYESTDDGPLLRFEKYQSMMDDALTHDPESGRPVRRVITGGVEIPRKKADPPKQPPRPHPDSCSCCNPPPRK